MLSKAASSTIFEFLVWLELGLNPGLQDLVNTLLIRPWGFILFNTADQYLQLTFSSFLLVRRTRCRKYGRRIFSYSQKYLMLFIYFQPSLVFVLLSSKMSKQSKKVHVLELQHQIFRTITKQSSSTFVISRYRTWIGW